MYARTQTHRHTHSYMSNTVYNTNVCHRHKQNSLWRDLLIWLFMQKKNWSSSTLNWSVCRTPFLSPVCIIWKPLWRSFFCLFERDTIIIYILFTILHADGRLKLVCAYAHTFAALPMIINPIFCAIETDDEKWHLLQCVDVYKWNRMNLNMFLFHYLWKTEEHRVFETIWICMTRILCTCIRTIWRQEAKRN